jgi:hypothetical protein
MGNASEPVKLIVPITSPPQEVLVRHPFIGFLIDLDLFWWLNLTVTAIIAGLLTAFLDLPMWQAILFGLAASYCGSPFYQRLKS